MGSVTAPENIRWFFPVWGWFAFAVWVELRKSSPQVLFVTFFFAFFTSAVPFFCRPAMTAPALALLALHFDCAVLPARVERLRGAHFRLTICPPLDLPRSGDRNADILAIMTAVNATLEGWIRECPEQWFWVHSRWPD